MVLVFVCWFVDSGGCVILCWCVCVFVDFICWVGICCFVGSWLVGFGGLICWIWVQDVCLLIVCCWFVLSWCYCVGWCCDWLVYWCDC